VVSLPARADDPGVRSVAASLVAGVFLGGVGGGVAFPTLPTLGPLIGVSPLVVGVILAANRATRLVLSTPAGQVLDRFGTRRPMIAGLFLQGLAPFGYVLGLYADRLPVVGPAETFVLARVLWGVGSAFVFVGAFATITWVTTSDNRGRWVGYMRGGQSLGFPTGLVVGGVVTDAAGYAVAFGVAGCAGLLAAIVAAAVLPDVRPAVEGRTGLRDLPRVLGEDTRVLVVCAVNFVVRFVFGGVLLSTVVIYAGENGVRLAGLTETGVSGLVMAVGVVVSAVTTVVVGRYSDRLADRSRVTLPGLAALGVGFLVLAFVPTLAGLLAALVLVGVGVGATNPPLLAYLGDISPADGVGKLGGVYNVFGDLGTTVGPVVALPLAAAVGLRVEYLVCASLVVLAGTLVARRLVGRVDPAAASVADDD